MKGNAVSHAYRKLSQHLLDGEVPPGDRLNESDLSRRFDVSRTPLREALNRLVGEGVVHQRAGEGFRRSSPGRTELAALRTTRHALLTIALHQACSPTRAEALRRAVAGWMAEERRLRPLPAPRLWQRRLLRAAAVSGNGALVRQIHRLNRQLAAHDAETLPGDESVMRVPVAVMMALVWSRPDALSEALSPLAPTPTPRNPLFH